MVLLCNSSVVLQGYLTQGTHRDGRLQTMCVLRNFLHALLDRQYTPPVEQDGSVREGFWRSRQLSVLGKDGRSSRSGPQEANTVRQHLVEYFSSESGSIPWQSAHGC